MIFITIEFVKDCTFAENSFCMKKFLVLGILFLLPLVAYLFFASGVNHFSKLPVLQTNIGTLEGLETPNDSLQLKNKISVVAFMGTDLKTTQGNIFNLNQKIYNYFYQFDDFQFLVILPKETEKLADEVRVKLDELTDTKNLHFIYGDDNGIRSFHRSLKTPYQLDSKLYSPYVFIIDREGNLRGRDDDDEVGELYGYDSSSVAEINGKMKDDVKVILAEYRLALKKYNKLKTKISE